MRVEKPHAAFKPRPAQDLFRKAGPLGRIHDRFRQTFLADIRLLQQLRQAFGAVFLRGIAPLQQAAERGFLCSVVGIFIAPEKALLAQRGQQPAEMLCAFKVFDGLGVAGQIGGKLAAFFFDLYDSLHQKPGDAFCPGVFCKQGPALRPAVGVCQTPDIGGNLGLSVDQILHQGIPRRESLRAGSEMIRHGKAILHPDAHRFLNTVFLKEPGPEILCRQFQIAQDTAHPAPSAPCHS